MSNYLIQSFTTGLPPRGDRLLLLAVALLVTGATVVAFSHGASVAQANTRSIVSVPATLPQPAIDEAPTLLPAVIVRPDPEMTTLATITVRPAHGLQASANSERPSDFEFDANGVVRNLRATNSKPSGTSFAMPYYSFSRSPRLSNKE